MVVIVGLLGWVCCGLGWLVVTVGLQWFVFVCDLVVGGWTVVVVVMAVVVGGGGCGRDETVRSFSKCLRERESVWETS